MGGTGLPGALVERAERVTGYVAGGISPLGQRQRLRRELGAGTNSA